MNENDNIYEEYEEFKKSVLKDADKYADIDINGNITFGEDELTTPVHIPDEILHKNNKCTEHKERSRKRKNYKYRHYTY
jgi:hypothetical protein